MKVIAMLFFNSFIQEDDLFAKLITLFIDLNRLFTIIIY